MKAARRDDRIRAGLVWLVAVLGGCWISSGSGDADRDSQQPPARLAWNAGLPLLPEEKPRSILYRQARLQWRTATIAFSSGQFERAADAFLDVAKILKVRRAHPHASTFATARCLAYENAGRSLGQTGDQDRAQERLAAAIDDDPTCPYAVRRAFGSISSARP